LRPGGDFRWERFGVADDLRDLADLMAGARDDRTIRVGSSDWPGQI